jgi:hypothetical protein
MFHTYVDATKGVVPSRWIRHDDSLSLFAINPVCAGETTTLKYNVLFKPELVVRIVFPPSDCPLTRATTPP